MQISFVFQVSGIFDDSNFPSPICNKKFVNYSLHTITSLCHELCQYIVAAVQRVWVSNERTRLENEEYLFFMCVVQLGSKLEAICLCKIQCWLSQ